MPDSLLPGLFLAALLIVTPLAALGRPAPRPAEPVHVGATVEYAALLHTWVEEPAPLTDDEHAELELHTALDQVLAEFRAGIDALYERLPGWGQALELAAV